jgi:glycosyltransferase involved in cell wall biosynthesis
MSRREGANRALYEALFCDTPAIVFARHRGVNTQIIRDGVGELFEADGLAQAIAKVLDNPAAYRARAWAERHTGYHNSTAQLNGILREMAHRRSLPWTRDIVEKKNAPDLLYVDPTDVERFRLEYESLIPFLR